MLDLPRIGPEEIKAEVIKRLADRAPGRRDGDRCLFAVYGTGSEEVVSVEPYGALHLVPVRSEIDLRAKLPPLGVEPMLTVYLVPWIDSLPADIVGRFATAHVVRMGRSERLKLLFRAFSVAPGMESFPLVKYLLRPDNPRQTYGDSVGHLTEELLWARWLSFDWGLETGAALARDVLLTWAAENGRGAQFSLAMQQPAASGVHEALLRHLGQRLGPLGPLIWRQWEAGRGSDLLAFGVICEATIQSERQQDAGVRVWLRQNLKARFGVADEETMAIAAELAETTPQALRLLQRARGPESESRNKLARELVARADSWVDHDIREAVAGSRRLLSAWNGRLDALGNALTEGAAHPTEDAVARATQLRCALEQHEIFRGTGDAPLTFEATGRQAEGFSAAHGSGTAEAKRAEMAVRLLGWLASSHERLASRGLTPHSDAESLSQWYAEEGGFVDWARREARGSGEGSFAAGVQSVLDRVDTLRAELDERFAIALVAWHAAERPAHQVVPLDQALRRFAVPFLQESERRRILVLLLDGMAWAQAVELMQSMRELGPPAPWGPLAWHDQAAHRVGSGRYPAVLANLPTTTEVSRAGFFAGKPLSPGEKLDSSADPQRFAENAVLRPFTEQDVAPRLMLRDESHQSDGSLTEAALELIRDQRRRIVGVVINAIDASLKADAQQRASWEVSNIKSLGPLLEAAREAHRQVLFVSDHGHVSFPPGLRSIACPAQAGARWRRYSGSHDSVQEHELVFTGPGVYAHKETTGAVLLTHDAVRYGGGSGAGEHGGATLAEVVVPCLLLGWDDFESASDSALRTASPFVPSWWHPASVPLMPLSASGVNTGAEQGAPPGERRKRDSARASRPSGKPSSHHSGDRSNGTPEENGSHAPNKSNQNVVSKSARRSANGALGEHVNPTLLHERFHRGPESAPQQTARVDAAESHPSSSMVGHAQPLARALSSWPPTRSALYQALVSSKMLEARVEKKAERERVAAAVEFLVEHGDAASAEAFAQHQKVPTWRIEGLVSRLSEKLNVDGYRVLGFDPQSRRVMLHRELLIQQFEVKL